MPIGRWFSASGVPASSIASAYSFDTIEAKSIARLATKGASGRVRLKRTVMSSTFSIDSISSPMDIELKYSHEPA